MTQPTDAAEVARKLTPAQRRAVLWLPEDGSWKARELIAREKQPTSVSLGRVFLAGACESRFERRVVSWRLTALGKAVRAQLQGEGGQDG